MLCSSKILCLLVSIREKKLVCLNNKQTLFFLPKMTFTSYDAVFCQFMKEETKKNENIIKYSLKQLKWTRNVIIELANNYIVYVTREKQPYLTAARKKTKN